MAQAVQIHAADNVAVALCPLQKGNIVPIGDIEVVVWEDVAQGHKFALRAIAKGDKIVKYGNPIGHATADIQPGAWVHVHNLATDLSEEGAYTYRPAVQPLAPVIPGQFMGFQREDGRVGIRNEIWILPTVGCVNDVAQRLATENAHLAANSMDGLYAFPHPYGCSQMGDDHLTTQKLLAALARHPNAGGVLVVGLGCENNTMEQFQQAIGPQPAGRIRYMVCQDVEDELAAGAGHLAELAEYAAQFKREPIPVSELVIGMKCGGSDGLSGITANPAVGAFSDKLIARGGSSILTEVPEMFGAESLLMNRAVNEAVYQRVVDMIDGFKQYFTAHGQVVYENPSPGNKQGGISTLEDKSLGCVQKGGIAPVADVIPYGGQVREKGLTLLSGPGNDLVSATALAAAGAHIVLFTTGRGTPFGAPVPTLKIASNSALYQKKNSWIDFDAGPVADGEPVSDAAERLLEMVIAVANGQQTKAEQLGYRGIAIFKSGVVL